MQSNVAAVFESARARTFDTAAALVVDYLKAAAPLSYWAVTRYDGDRQLYLEVRDDHYGLVAGNSHAWSDSMCMRMLAGDGPQVAVDAMAIPAYKEAGIAKDLAVGTYVGIPIELEDGELFGTLCGMDPAAQTAEFAQNEQLFDLLASLLSMVLEADLQNTELARALERAESVADTDNLTGLLNRRGWERVFAAEEARLRRFGHPCAVIVTDLDGLKEINDEQGHVAGDRYLKLAAQALRSCVRAYDYVARLGGDEFGVLATGISPADTAMLVRRIEEAFNEQGVSASIGSAPYNLAGGLAGTLAAADEAMYVAKRHRSDQRCEDTLGP